MTSSASLPVDRGSRGIPRESVDVLGVNVSAINMDMALGSIQGWIESGDHQYVCVTGVHGVMESQSDESLRAIHNRAGLVTPDGMPLVWLSRLRGAKHVQRVYGPDLMDACCEVSVRHGWRHFFFGGAPGVAELLADRLRRRFPSLKIVGTFSPAFRPLTELEDEEVVRLINEARPDIVWVGLSTPKQERWMAAHHNRLQASVLLGVGAAFDFHAGLKRQAPRWMQRIGMEWSFRLATEPRRLWRRYLTNNPRFAWNLMRQAFRTGVAPVKTAFKRRIKAFGLSLHRAAERLGVHALPVHYYSALPDRHVLDRTRGVWARPSELPGLDWDLEQQFENLRTVVSQSAEESDGLDAYERATQEDFGFGFGPIEARALYAVLRAVKPARVVEVGAGVSTAVTLAALARNGIGHVTSIDPHPRAALRRLPVTLIESPAQAVPLETYAALQAGDVLFIDSTHVVRVGGDVNFIVLEVLPRLRPGVVVHFHDIFLPYDYPPDLFQSLWSWAETSLVRAYLTGNRSVQVLFCLAALHHANPAALAGILDYRPRPMTDGLYTSAREQGTDFPASLWLRVGESRQPGNLSNRLLG
jgi:N-acetylglucosaminyldiphosphoundecaprenol N-acetyl-beta-D-mannosaminyltransferase